MSSDPTTETVMIYAPAHRSLEDNLTETMHLLEGLLRRKGVEVSHLTPPTGDLTDTTSRCLILARGLAGDWAYVSVP